MVASNTGKNGPKKMMNPADTLPMPNHRMARGIQARDWPQQFGHRLHPLGRGDFPSGRNAQRQGQGQGRGIAPGHPLQAPDQVPVQALARGQAGGGNFHEAGRHGQGRGQLEGGKHAGHAGRLPQDKQRGRGNQAVGAHRSAVMIKSVSKNPLTRVSGLSVRMWPICLRKATYSA